MTRHNWQDIWRTHFLWCIIQHISTALSLRHRRQWITVSMVTNWLIFANRFWFGDRDISRTFSLHSWFNQRKLTCQSFQLVWPCLTSFDPVTSQGHILANLKVNLGSRGYNKTLVRFGETSVIFQWVRRDHVLNLKRSLQHMWFECSVCPVRKT